MALFARRVLQDALNELNRLAGRKKMRDWVSKLNNASERNYVATEWEIVLLRTLSRLGNLVHPEESSRCATLDIIFTSPENDLSFGADIVAISDRGLREHHPIHKFQRELRRRFVQTGLRQGGFKFRVEQLSLSTKGAKPEVLLPGPQHYARVIFDDQFKSFVEEIRSRPQASHVYRVVHNSPRTVLSIFYDPRFNGTDIEPDQSHIPIHVIDKNPLYYTLADKADQLERSGYAGLRGIIVCDSGARVLTEKQNWYSFCTAEVVLRFLQENPSVDFVLTIGLEDQFTGTLTQKLVPQLFAAREERWLSKLAKLFDKVLAQLPMLVQSPENAYRDLEFESDNQQLLCHLGALRMSTGPDGIEEIRMSTGTLLDLLAGRLRQDQFLRRYSLQDGIAIFESVLRSGRLISEASVNRVLDEDDDEIVFRFGKLDAAAGKFIRPPVRPKQ